MLEENEGAEVPLQIYSTKRKEIRGALPVLASWAASYFSFLPPLTPNDAPSTAEVYVIPSRNWSSAAVPGGEAGMVDGQPSLLGLSLRVCSPQFALDQVRRASFRAIRSSDR